MSTTTSRSTRLGCIRAVHMATLPPILWPIRIHFPCAAGQGAAEDHWSSLT
uniref:Uncharacterized protein n=1 Tax=Anguilla anguilla TaxID=7936 RepID=A0A0E9Q456_ANGAN